MASRVIIKVVGGVADVISKPKSLAVEIRDYDVEGCEEERLSHDGGGDPYVLSVWDTGSRIKDGAEV